MLTLSERWLTTQTFPFGATATAHGSMPTGTEAVFTRPTSETAKIASWLSGMLTA